MTTKQEAKKEIVPAERPLGGVLTPSGSDEAIIAAFKRYQDLKTRLLDDSDYTHFVRWQMGDGKPSTRGYVTLKEADAEAKKLKGKGFTVVQERRIKKSGVLKLDKAFSISIEIVSETLFGGVVGSPTGVTYRVRAVAPNGQYAERTGSCDRAEKGRGDSPWDHVSAIALTRASNRASMVLLGGETTAEETVEEVHAFDNQVVSTAPAVAAALEKRPEQKTEAELKADLDKKFAEKKPAKPTNLRNEYYKRLHIAMPRTGMTNEQWKERMLTLYKVSSAKDLSETDLWGFMMGVEEVARLHELNK